MLREIEKLPRACRYFGEGVGYSAEIEQFMDSGKRFMEYVPENGKGLETVYRGVNAAIRRMNLNRIIKISRRHERLYLIRR